MYYKVARENMTFEEAIEAFKKGEIIRYKQGKPLCPSETKDIEGIGFTIEQIHSNDWLALIDWFNKHQFDYRGLIEKNLAIEVTEENNPYKE